MRLPAALPKRGLTVSTTLETQVSSSPSNSTLYAIFYRSASAPAGWRPSPEGPFAESGQAELVVAAKKIDSSSLDYCVSPISVPVEVVRG